MGGSCCLRLECNSAFFFVVVQIVPALAIGALCLFVLTFVYLTFESQLQREKKR